MKKKAYHLTTVHPRNDVRIFHNECKFLSKNGWNIELVVFDNLGDDVKNNISIKDLGSSKNNRASRLIRNLSITTAYFLSKIKESRGSIIHFHDPEIIFISGFLRLMGYKIIFDAHEDLPKQISSKPWIKKSLKPFFVFLAKLLDKAISLSATHIVAATQYIGNKFPNEKTILVRNLPAKEDFSQVFPKKTNGNINICYIGSISEERGIFDILDALVILNKNNKVTLKLGGKFSSTSIEKNVIAHPAWPHVDFLGWVNRDQFQKIASECIAGLIPLHPYPNYLESYPNKMFEYMACSIPIVCSNFPLWKQILNEIECALFFESKSAQDLSEKIQYLINNKISASKMGNIGRAAFEEKLNWQGEFKKLLDMYNK